MTLQIRFWAVIIASQDYLKEVFISREERFIYNYSRHGRSIYANASNKMIYITASSDPPHNLRRQGLFVKSSASDQRGKQTRPGVETREEDTCKGGERGVHVTLPVRARGHGGQRFGGAGITVTVLLISGLTRPAPAIRARIDLV